MKKYSKAENTLQVIKDLSVEEMLFIIGRYCGPHNSLLCEKKYNCILSKEVIEKYIGDKLMDDLLSSDSEPSTTIL